MSHIKRAVWAIALAVLVSALAFVVGNTRGEQGVAVAQDTGSAPSEPLLTADDWPLNASAARGRLSYGRWCVGCHGADGRGRGPAAQFLDPLPRDFRAGRIKFRSTPSGSLPLVSDLARTIAKGLPGSSMPSFPLVPDLEREDLAEYVLALVQFGRAEREVSALADEGVTRAQMLSEHLPRLAAEAAAERAGLRPVSISDETTDDLASRERGRVKFAEACASCHGLAGRGDGGSAPALRDELDAPISPRDFTVAQFRGGGEPVDIFRRIRTGLDGTPMPGFREDGAVLWDLVHFVTSLRKTAPEDSASSPMEPR